MTIGIYVLRLADTTCIDKYYVGQSHDIKKRIAQHIDKSNSPQFVKSRKIVGSTPPMTSENNNLDTWDKDYSKIQDKTIVAIDPNLSDLLYCVDGDIKERKFFRYTQDQRRKETKHKKYRDLILEFKKEKIDGKTIIELETKLSTFNRKSLDIIEFKKYIKKKNEINHKLFEFYKKYIFRKLKLNNYTNRLKTEQNMIRQFKKIFGEPIDTIICIGDFEQKKQLHR
jgi:hypothetical protein